MVEKGAYIYAIGSAGIFSKMMAIIMLVFVNYAHFNRKQKCRNYAFTIQLKVAKTSQ